VIKIEIDLEYLLPKLNDAGGFKRKVKWGIDLLIKHSRKIESEVDSDPSFYRGCPKWSLRLGPLWRRTPLMGLANGSLF
jgi:hypothetical protein